MILLLTMGKRRVLKIGIEKIAKGMLAEKLPLELIVKLTGLTPVEIENLIDEDFNDE
jgi:hypothetical protein